MTKVYHGDKGFLNLRKKIIRNKKEEYKREKKEPVGAFCIKAGGNFASEKF